MTDEKMKTDQTAIEADQGTTSEAHDSALVPSGAEAKEALESVERESEEKRKALIQEAFDALAQTRDVMKLLGEGKNKEALDLLTLVTGKLDLVIAREPSLALAPIDIQASVVNVMGSASVLELLVEDARSALRAGRVQEARALLSNLASEIVIETTQLPMATYPAAIKLAARHIDEGKPDEAKLVLMAALGSLVISRQVMPLPLINARNLLKRAESLAEKADRSADEEQELAAVLDGAAAQIRRAEILGYGTRDEIKALQSHIRELKRKTEGGRFGKKWFEEAKASLMRLFKSSEKAGSGAEKAGVKP